MVDPQHRSLETEEQRFYGLDLMRDIFGVDYTSSKGEILPFTGWRFDVSHVPGGNIVYEDSSPSIFTRMGFHSVHQNWGGGSFQTYAIAIHYWVLLVFFAVISWALVRPAKRSAPYERPFCGTCGYDLRASPDRCPECGTKGSAINGVDQTKSQENQADPTINGK
jgi:hypothetical protein